MVEYQRNEVRRLSTWLMISLAFALFFLLVLLPLTSTYKFALEDGLGDFTTAITTKGALTAMGNSLIIATAATLINMGVGTLIAFVIVRFRFPGRSLFRALIDLPIAVPTAVVGLSLMMLYGPQGLLGPLMEDLGLQVMLALPGVLLAHIFVTFPFMVRAVSVVMEKLDPAQEEAAQMLGATRRQTFWHVTLPSIRGGLVAGTALTFTRSLGEFGATLFIAGGMVRTGPIYIYYLSDSKFDYQAASSVAILLMILPFVILLGLNFVVDRLEAR
jgi:sulfate transport system permease protein